MPETYWTEWKNSTARPNTVRSNIPKTKCSGSATSTVILLYANGITSPRAYKIIKPKELRGLFLPYHTLEPMQAIERILEAKGLPLRNEAERLQRQYEIFRKIRQSG